MQVNTWILILLSVLLGTLGGYGLTRHMLSESLNKINLMTPVFVMDRAAMIQTLPPSTSPEAMSEQVRSWRQKAKQLAEAGFLVIDANVIIAAPEDIYVHVR